MEDKIVAPKVKVTKEAIIEEALKMIRNESIESINARDLAKQLNCSVQPIFRTFQSMENLKTILYENVENIFDEHMKTGMSKHPIPFLGMGLAYISFAKTEKNLFKFLFMQDGFKGNNLLDMIKSDDNKAIVQIIASMSGLSVLRSEQLFLSIWLMTHGIAALMASNDCDLSDETIEQLLMDTFSGIKLQLKSKGNNL